MNRELEFYNEVKNWDFSKIKYIEECLTNWNMYGILIIRGVDKLDCWELKKLFKRGQAYNDIKPISLIDYENILIERKSALSNNSFVKFSPIFKSLETSFTVKFFQGLSNLLIASLICSCFNSSFKLYLLIEKNNSY